MQYPFELGGGWGLFVFNNCFLVYYPRVTEGYRFQLVRPSVCPLQGTSLVQDASLPLFIFIARRIRISIVDVQRRSFSLFDQKMSKQRGSELRCIWDSAKNLSYVSEKSDET